MSDWKPVGWWRAVASDGSIWAEASDEHDIRSRARDGDTIQRLVFRTEEKWVDDYVTPDKEQSDEG